MASEALRGHVDLLLLAVIGDGAAHGYAVIEALRDRSGGYFDLPEGTIYPALYRLEQAGLLSSTWAADTARRRRVYSLTAAGRAALAERRRAWDAFAASVVGVLGGNDVGT
jgi:PadR family transcriptional regulator PadR